MKIKALAAFLATLCIINQASAQYDYNCNTVYPKKIHCPEGYNCVVGSVTCFTLAGLGKAIVEETFSLPVKDNEFVQLGTINEPTKIDIKHLPALGNYVAYEFTGSQAEIPTPVQIVLRTQAATPELLKLLGSIAGNVDHLKDKEITVWYRRLPQWDRDQKFEIHNYSVNDKAKDAQIDIMVTPEANLQVIKPSTEKGQKEVFEIATGEVIQG